MQNVWTRWVLIALMALMAVACGNNSPSAVVKGFYKNIEQGEITKAMDALSERILIIGEPKLRKALEAQTDSFSQMGGIKKIDVKDDCKGEVCRVDAKITFNNGKEMSERVDMVKENKVWKIGKRGLF